MMLVRYLAVLCIGLALTVTSASAKMRSIRLVNESEHRVVIAVSREDRPGILMLRARHDGYARRFGILHERTLLLAADGSRLEGEDLFLDAGGGPKIRTTRDKFAVRFHLHPSIKATKLTDGHGVMMMMPNKEVWTFVAPHDRVEIEDSVYLASPEGARRAMQIVIHGEAALAPRVS